MQIYDLLEGQILVFGEYNIKVSLSHKWTNNVDVAWIAS